MVPPRAVRGDGYVRVGAREVPRFERESNGAEGFVRDRRRHRVIGQEGVPPDASLGPPGYTALTLRGGWQVSQGLRLSAALENLFDADYRIHGSGVNEPGRNAVVSLVWKSR